jgi:hypothetical protein
MLDERSGTQALATEAATWAEAADRAIEAAHRAAALLRELQDVSWESFGDPAGRELELDALTASRALLGVATRAAARIGRLVDAAADETGDHGASAPVRRPAGGPARGARARARPPAARAAGAAVVG